MKKSNKKIPKSHLPKFEGGGSNFNEFGFNVEGQGQGSSTQNMYNDKRSSKISSDQYAQAGAAIGTGGVQAFQGYNDPYLNDLEKTRSVQAGADTVKVGVATAINPLLGAGVGAVTKIGAGVQSNVDRTDANGNLINRNDSKIGEIAGGLLSPSNSLIGIYTDPNATTGQKVAGALTGGLSDMFTNRHRKQVESNAKANLNQYPFGGMNMQPNAEIESEENVVAPNGGFLQANGPTHEKGGVPVALPGNSMVFSDRLKLGKKTFAELNKVNNTNKEDKILESNKYGNTSKHTAELMKFAKNKNSEALFNAQEALKQAKVEAYAKKMGITLPQAQEAPEEGMQFAMGGKLPMYEDGGPVDSLGVRVNTLPSDSFKFSHKTGNKEVYVDPGNMQRAFEGSSKTKDVEGYNNFLRMKMASGISPDELVKQGYATTSGISNLKSSYNPKYVYMESFGKPSVTPTNTQMPYDQRIDRKEVSQNMSTDVNYYDYPDANAGYSKATRVAFDRNSGREIDPMKSYDPKGNYTPYFNLETGRDLYKNTIKSSTPGTNPTNLNLNNQGDLRKEATQSTSFKYGGKMLPKFWTGGKMVNGTWVPDNYDIITAHNATNSYKPGTIGYYDSMNSPDKPSNDSLQSSYGPDVLPWNRSNDSGNSTAYDNTVNPQQFQEVTSNSKSNIGSPKVTDPNDKNFDWGKLKTVGQNYGNFALQNAGNIYDLTRKKDPLQKYDRATAKFLDPSSAIRDALAQTRRAEYNVRGASGGNAGTYLSNRVALNAQNTENLARIHQNYQNANAQISNQNSQFNTEIAYREAEAQAKDRAMRQNVDSQAIHSMASNFGKMSKSSKQDNMEQKELDMFMYRYKNEPGFKEQVDKFRTT